jgi:hypothetical protein
MYLQVFHVSISDLSLCYYCSRLLGHWPYPSLTRGVCFGRVSVIPLSEVFYGETRVFEAVGELLNLITYRLVVLSVFWTSEHNTIT